MYDETDFWYYLEKLEYGKWYDLRTVYNRLLEVIEGFDMEFDKWVALVVVSGVNYWVDIERLQIQHLKFKK
jgi:hypothetical protein